MRVKRQRGEYNSPSQEKYHPLRGIKYNPELKLALAKMREHRLTFNGRVKLMLQMFKERFHFIEVIKLHQ